MTDALCIVPCGKAKIWEKHPHLGPIEARKVYTGTFAGAARRYAEHFHEHWVILSAKHGFLLPTDLVQGTYEVTFKRKRDPLLVTPEALREQIASKQLDRFDLLVVIAGRDYVEPVRRAFAGAKRLMVPLVTATPPPTSMGAMISALNRAVTANRPL